MSDKLLDINGLIHYDEKLKQFINNNYEQKDADIVRDADYVHTDNNFDDAYKLKVDSMTGGSVYIGLFNTLADRDTYSDTLVNGMWCSVESDDNYSNKKTKYRYDGSQWLYDGTYMDDTFGIDDNSTTSTNNGWSANKLSEELDKKANIDDIPTKVSELTNDSDFISSTQVDSTYMKTEDYTGTGTTPVNVAETLEGLTKTIEELNKSISVDNIIAGENIEITEDGNGILTISSTSNAKAINLKSLPYFGI